MDPVGLGLENFDSVGTYRTTDNNVPIDATGVLDGMAFQDEASLAKVLRSHPQAASCFVSKLYEQSQGRQLHYESVGQILFGMEPENLF